VVEAAVAMVVEAPGGALTGSAPLVAQRQASISIPGIRRIM
jgi:hypothetical protein